MIPKIIHYCWFGPAQKPQDVLAYIDSWHKVFPDFEIMEWNETNFDVNICSYSLQAYREKKYAFVSDYARLWALNEYGGLYFDTDIEAIKSVEPLFENTKLLLGFEDNEKIMTGFIGACKEHPIIKELLDIYETKSFYLPNGDLDTTPNPVLFTQVLTQHGLIPNGKKQSFSIGAVAYPVDYFSAIDMSVQRLCVTENTYLIHHCMASWYDSKGRRKRKIKKVLVNIMGEKLFKKLYNKFYKK